MQMVFQNPLASFNPKMTIGAAFNELGSVYGLKKAETNKKVEDLLDYVHLRRETLTCLPKELSGGQLQRLAIARALLLAPKFLLADEPVSALDVSVQSQVLNLMLDLKEQRGMTILFISHDLTVVRHVCNTVAVVYLGVIVELGPTETVYNYVMHPYTEALISARPRDHPLEDKKHILLEGDMSTAINVPAGCRFAGRCRKFTTGLCDNRTPKLRELEPGHFVACHYPIEYNRAD
jgi:oligopeptide/dipeptide ABC transporter ATP-binding protein